MKKSLKITLFNLVIILGSYSFAVAQEDIFGLDTRPKEKGIKSKSGVGNIFRNAVSLFSFEISGGGAYHFNDMVFNSDFPSQYPISQYQTLDVPRELTPNDTLSLYSNGLAFPFNAGVRINLFNMLTIGGGYGREFGSIGNLVGGDYQFAFENSRYTFDKLYGTVGLVLYDSRKRAKFLSWKYRRFSADNYAMQSEVKQRIRQNYPWRFILEGEFGNILVRQSYDPRLVATDEPFYNVGLRVEREFSEYARLFVKTGVELRNFQYQAGGMEEFQHIKQSLYAVQVGVSISMPGTKRCKVNGCGVVMKHLHDGVEYRGSSIFQLQNRRVGQWY